VVQPIVIIGAGGFGRHTHDVIDSMNEQHPVYEVIGFLDDGTPSEELLAARDSKHLGPIRLLEDMPADVRYVIGIGSGAVRRKIDAWATSAGREPIIAVHRSATFGRNVTLSPGTVVCAHTSIGTNIHLGRHVHLNFNCTVGHDTVMEDYVSAYPGANIAGNVLLENGATVGTGAAIIQGVEVGRDSFIGAAAGVVRNIPPGVTAVGVPARPRDQNTQ
jgi:sugar O-acyltransferase (sialic acid O-acetyltransferase NeuD family)